MEVNSINVGKFIFEQKANITDVTEFGFSLAETLSGSIPLPAAGARFDVTFGASISGPRLNGTVTGTNYLHMRADGRLALHIHARITTDDGENISYFADGVATSQEGTPLRQLRENITFITASPAYAWLNQLQVWGVGIVDPGKGESRLKAYAA